MDISPIHRDVSLAVGYSALVLLVLCMPGDTISDPGGWGFELPSGSDKLVHAGLFFIETLCLRQALRWRAGSLSPLVLAMGMAFVLALFTEWAQSVIPMRDGSGLDLLADAIGIGLYATISRIRAGTSDHHESH